MRTENSYKLQEFLREAFMNCGEVLNGKDIAFRILDFETFENITLTSGEIRKAIWYASDDFVDSMQENAHHTLQANRPDFGQKECDEMCAYYEKQRPSVRRLAQLETIVGKF